MPRGRVFSRLREARSRACLSQKELADQVGISAARLSRLENDPFTKIDPLLRQRLAEVLEVTEEEVWEQPLETMGPYYDHLSVGERNFIGAYMRFNRTSRPRLIQILQEIDREEAKKRGKPTKKSKSDP